MVPTIHYTSSHSDIHSSHHSLSILPFRYSWFPSFIIHPPIQIFIVPTIHYTSSHSDIHSSHHSLSILTFRYSQFPSFIIHPPIKIFIVPTIHYTSSHSDIHGSHHSLYILPLRYSQFPSFIIYPPIQIFIVPIIHYPSSHSDIHSSHHSLSILPQIFIVPITHSLYILPFRYSWFPPFIIHPPNRIFIVSIIHYPSFYSDIHSYPKLPKNVPPSIIAKALINAPPPLPPPSYLLLSSISCIGPNIEICTCGTLRSL